MIKKAFAKFRKVYTEFCVMMNANNIIGKYSDIAIRKNQVNLHQYHPKSLYPNMNLKNDYNLGDSLGEVVAKYLLKKNNIDINKKISSTKYFYCIGSNILASYQNATIWGAGITPLLSKFKRFLQKISRRKLDIRAVRGPLTRDFLLRQGFKCPEIYGDPAILMPLIYTPNCKQKRYKKLIIPQFACESKFRQKYFNEKIVSMNTNDYETVIDEIVSSEIVYTSSLHGIILAESYGVPAIFFRSLPKNEDFKYLDYYYSTGRKNIKIAESFEEALKMEPLPIPNLTELRQGLLESFPYDLWEN